MTNEKRVYEGVVRKDDEPYDGLYLDDGTEMSPDILTLFRAFIDRPVRITVEPMIQLPNGKWVVPVANIANMKMKNLTEEDLPSVLASSPYDENGFKPMVLSEEGAAKLLEFRISEEDEESPDKMKKAVIEASFIRNERVLDELAKKGR